MKSNITSLKYTFDFIRHYQNLCNSTSKLTTLTLKVSLTSNESNINLGPTVVATNTILGQIKEIHNTFVVLSYPNIIDEQISYHISYDSIITLYSSYIKEFYREYSIFMNEIDELCSDEISFVKSYKTFESENKNRDIRMIILIDGSLSREFKLGSLSLINDLFILEQSIIIPPNKISGIVFNDTCQESVDNNLK